MSQPSNTSSKTKADWAAEWKKACLEEYNKELTGSFRHYCPDWDLLPIDDTCPEFQQCTCDWDWLDKGQPWK